MKRLNTTSEVIDALGGTTAFARLSGKKAQHVTNWRASGRFPAELFLVHSRILGENAIEAPVSLWGIKTDVPRTPGQQAVA
jgi:hypothetical protein